MLYLLLDFIVDDYYVGHEILKIGYSNKAFSTSREKSYNTCNYGYKLLGEIEGTSQDETNLHRKYKHLLLPGSTEWFEYSEEIVNEFFPDAEPEEDVLKLADSISPITMKDLEKEYLPSIINPDYLLGTIDSIYVRISESKNAARYIWKKLLTGSSIQDISDLISKKIERTNSLLSVLETARDENNRQVCCEVLKTTSELDPYGVYIAVTGEEGNYEAKFNTGRLKIDQLALEAYKKELEKKK